MKYWEIIADHLYDAGWGLGWVSAFDDYGRTIWIADAHREGTRFVVRANRRHLAKLEELEQQLGFQTRVGAVGCCLERASRAP